MIRKEKNYFKKENKKKGPIINEKIVNSIYFNEKTRIVDLVKQFEKTSFQSRNLYKAFQVLKLMETDKDRPIIFLSLAGAMIPGGMKGVIIDLIKNNMVDVIVSTGANITHDIIEGLGYSHYIGSPNCNDKELRQAKICRIYDTYVLEEGFIAEEKFILETLSHMEKREYSSREFLYHLGKSLKSSSSFVSVASEHGVPIFCPALNDCDIGIALTHHYAKSNHNERIIINPIRDNYEIYQIYSKAKKTGVIMVGGGVPRNYVQQVSVIAEMLEGKKASMNPSLGHQYGVLITTDDPKWGGLSGCTFSESISWGKYSTTANTATVYGDATIIFPILIGALMQEIGKDLINKPRVKFLWEKDILKEIIYENPILTYAET
ncbi:MAG: deoxyhypusine synthase family protein [Nitrososphaerota archaeon]